MDSKKLAYEYKLAEGKLKNLIRLYATLHSDEYHWLIASGSFVIEMVMEEYVKINTDDKNHVLGYIITFDELNTVGD